MLPGLKKGLHIAIHLRRQWIFSTGLLLCNYSLIINGIQAFRNSSLNYQSSAIACDGSCSLLCGLNASSFTSMNQGVVATHRYMPRRSYLPTPVTARDLEIRSHPHETWWLDPRRQPTYCQWGWPVVEEPQFELVRDQFVGSPHEGKYWAEVPGKFFLTSWDELQNRLTTIPDSVITAAFEPHVVHNYLAPIWWAGVLIIAGCFAHAAYQMAPYRYGTVRYILELEQLIDSSTRRRQNTVFICLWVSLSLVFYIISYLTRSSQSGVYMATRSLVFLINGIGAYNLATEASAITPDMVKACPEDLTIPLSWFTPTTLTLAQLFAVILVPYKALRRAKERPDGWADLADHLDTRIIQDLSLQDLQRIRAMWAQQESQSTPLKPMTTAELLRQPSTQRGRQRKPEPPPSVQGPRHPVLTPILRGLHLCICLKEYWVVWLSMLSSTHSLLGIAALRLNGAAKCLCTCQSATDTPFQDCYAQAQAETLLWLSMRKIVMYALSAVFVVCLGIKLTIDYCQVRGVAYGTLEYILRLELNKRALPNRILYGFTSVCVLGVTMTCVVIAGIRVSQDGRSLLALLIYGLELLLQGLSCFILFTEAGYMTPASIRDVPTIHLPMRFTQASDFVLAKLLRFTGLTEEQVNALPEHPELIKKHRLSWLLARHLAPADILAITRFLRREGLGRSQSRSVQLGRGRVAKVYIDQHSSEESVDASDDKGDMECGTDSPACTASMEARPALS